MRYQLSADACIRQGYWGAPHKAITTVLLAVGCLFIAATGNAPGQDAPPWAKLDIDAQVRDAVFDAEAERLYLAVYDRNEIWVLEPDTAAVEAQYPTGNGPSHLAISANGAYLAVTNRLDNSVSVFSLPDFENLGSLDTGEGPVQVRATENHEFLVTAMYADQIVRIQPETMERNAPVPAGSAVPVDAVLLPNNRIAMLGRAQGELAIQAANNPENWRRIALEGVPVGLFPIGDQELIAATRTGLYRVDYANHRIVDEKSLPLRAVRFDGRQLQVLDQDQVHILDLELRVLDTQRLEGAALLLGGDGTHPLALAPTQQALYLGWRPQEALGVEASSSDAPAESRAPALTDVSPTPAPDDADSLVIEEAAPVGEETEEAPETPEASPAETPDVESETPAQDAQDVEAPQPSEEAIAPTTAPEETAVAAAPTATTADAETEAEADVEAADDQPKTTPEHAAPLTPAARTQDDSVHQLPLKTGEVTAPRTAAAPMPVRELSQKSIIDALRQPTEFGSSEAGFQPPDWTDPMRYFEADDMEQDLGTGDMFLEGNVRLRLGNMFFESDSFDFMDQDGAIAAQGNIRLEQESSYLTADQFTYQLPDEDSIPERYPFEPPLDEEGQARQRLTMGRVTAENVLIVEPTREIMADEIDYDFTEETGYLDNPSGRAGIYYYGAEELHVHGPECFDGEDIWVTTCDLENPHYRIRLSEAHVEDGRLTEGSHARLQLGRFNTPFYLPRYRATGFGGHPWNMDYDSGRRAALGYFLNVGQRVEVTPDFSIGPRIFVTEKEGVGGGIDFEYDFMESPASRLYRSKGSFNSLYTTDDRGILDFHHRYEYDRDLVLRLQAEQWSDQDFYKDFYFDDYRNRTAPRTFANVVYRQPDYIATGTVRLNTHNWNRQTESMPAVGFHLLERPLSENLYFSMDSLHGYYNRKPDGSNAFRTTNQARLTYSMRPMEGLSITPYGELDATWYSQQRLSGDSDIRISPLVGVTAQSRFHKAYPGAWGFSAFKHVVLPSITYSFRPDTNWNLAETHRFDALDNIFGRNRIETRLDNIFYGRDAETDEVWQVGRLTLYQGNDIDSETTKSEDYEIELDLRPRPWWGFQLVGERHVVTSGLGRPFLETLRMEALERYEDRIGRPYDSDTAFYLGKGNYSRLLAQVYYDELSPESPFSGRLGFAYTATQNRKYNRDILYGLGYRVGEKWGLAFEHTYDMDRGNLRTQTYEIRRSLHCWETAIRFRERESGFDVDLTFYIKAFPGSRLKF